MKKLYYVLKKHKMGENEGEQKKEEKHFKI